MKDLVEGLIAEVGSDIVTVGADIPARYRRDWAALPETLPLALCRPRTVEDVAAILAFCHQHSIPVVPQGGLTGISGAAHPSKDGIVLSLERMDKIMDVSVEDQTMTAQAGAILERAQAAAKGAGLMLAIDIGARGSCQLGGLVATNAGGHNVLRYGMTREQVLGLQVVLADGTILDDMNTMTKNNAGLDLKHLFIGTEGLLGVITACVFRLHADVVRRDTALVGCPSTNAAVSLLSRARARLGPMLSCYEVMWDSFYDTMAERCHVPRPLSGKHPVYVITEATGGPGFDTRTALEGLLEDAFEEGLIEDAVLSSSVQDEIDIWAVRETPAEYAAVIGPVIPFDVGLPAAAIADAVTQITDNLKQRWPDVIAMFYGHIGDNNLHLVVHLPSAGDALAEKEVKAIVYDRIRAAGGTISAEHGIGLIKRDYLQHSRSDVQIRLMQSVKNVLDPKGILNPGKGFDRILT